MNIPNEERQGEEPLNKENVHQHNREEEQRAHSHENQNPDLGKGRNPTHHNKENR